MVRGVEQAGARRLRELGRHPRRSHRRWRSFLLDQLDSKSTYVDIHGMRRQRALSPHAQKILLILLDAGSRWSHGYELTRGANIKSGTLYPLLVRLAEQGYLEAEWQPPAEAGRPPRHAYRLTAAGVELARSVGSELLSGRNYAPGGAS